MGYATPLLYPPNVAQRFREITSGNDDGYSAGPGWNPCTGLSSLNGSRILTVLESRAARTPPRDLQSSNLLDRLFCAMLGSTPGPMTSGDQLARVEAKMDELLRQNRTLRLLTIVVIVVLFLTLVLIFI